MCEEVESKRLATTIWKIRISGTATPTPKDTQSSGVAKGCPKAMPFPPKASWDRVQPRAKFHPNFVWSQCQTPLRVNSRVWFEMVFHCKNWKSPDFQHHVQLFGSRIARSSLVHTRTDLIVFVYHLQCCKYQPPLETMDPIRFPTCHHPTMMA